MFATTAMFVRYRKTARRLQLSLVETRRVHGMVRHEHIASLGSIARTLSIDGRIEFWRQLPERLEKISIPIDATARTRILAGIATRVPKPTPYEEHKHQLDSAPIDDEKPTITVPGAPDFSPYFEQLLKTAEAKSTPASRTALNSSLQEAWGDFQYERKQQRRQAPQDLVERTKNSIRKTRELLAELEKCEGWRDIGFDHCPVDDVTIGVAKFPNTPKLPRNPPPLDRLPETYPPHGLQAGVNRKRVLDRTLRYIDHHHSKRKRGNQQERDKAAVVAYAGLFFRQYSSAEPTSYFNGPFAKFSKHFYEVVTRQTLTSFGLDKAIAEEVKNPQLFATQIPQDA